MRLGVAQLDGAVDVVGHDQLLDLGHERRRVDVRAEHDVEEPLEADGRREDRAGQDEVHEGAAFIEHRDGIDHVSDLRRVRHLVPGQAAVPRDVLVETCELYSLGGFAAGSSREESVRPAPLPPIGHRTRRCPRSS